MHRADAGREKRTTFFGGQIFAHPTSEVGAVGALYLNWVRKRWQRNYERNSSVLFHSRLNALYRGEHGWWTRLEQHWQFLAICVYIEEYKKNWQMAKKYVTPREATRTLGMCDRTLRYWEEQGKIKTIRTAGGQRRYDITTYTTGTAGDRTIILYARVSSPKQKEDLQRQCEYLQSRYPEERGKRKEERGKRKEERGKRKEERGKSPLPSLFSPLFSLLDGELIKEVGGGLNYKRKKMLAVLDERVMSGNVKSIVVTYKDRLARFGFDLLKWLGSQHSCEIVVLNNVELSPEREMVEDILSILHCFSARLYGLRKYSSQIAPDKNLPRKKSPSNLETVVSSK